MFQNHSINGKASARTFGLDPRRDAAPVPIPASHPTRSVSFPTSTSVRNHAPAPILRPHSETAPHAHAAAAWWNLAHAAPAWRNQETTHLARMWMHAAEAFVDLTLLHK
jgi:hypothetical protein